MIDALMLKGGGEKELLSLSLLVQWESNISPFFAPEGRWDGMLHPSTDAQQSCQLAEFNANADLSRCAQLAVFEV